MTGTWNHLEASSLTGPVVDAGYQLGQQQELLPVVSLCRLVWPSSHSMAAGSQGHVPGEPGRSLNSHRVTLLPWLTQI